MKLKYLGHDPTTYVLLMFDFFTDDSRRKKVGMFLELFDRRWEITWGTKATFNYTDLPKANS